MKKLLLVLVCAPIAVFVGLCTQGKNDVEVTRNKAPRYANPHFISLTKLHTIEVGTPREYFISEVSWMDADSAGNLYILDAYESKIAVFDSNGSFIRAFGSSGQGPLELESPRNFSILHNKILILEKFKGIKAFTLNGNYMDFIPLSEGNVVAIKAFDDFYLGLYLWLDPRDTNLQTWSLIRYTKSFKNDTQIVEIKKKSNLFNLFGRTFVNAVDSKFNAYFPDNDDQYIVRKYSSSGGPLSAFGRDFERKPYSSRVKQWAHEKWGRETSIPEYPPVVRCVFVDDRDLIWVLTGECFLDCNSEIRVQSTMDIFNQKGEFLNTFETSAFSRVSFIKNGRLYSGPNDADDYSIKVYKIEYDSGGKTSG
jgi:hypothetical protein